MCLRQPFVLFDLLFLPDSNLYTEEERLIHDHIEHLLTVFTSATVVIIVESNADHRWPARLCQINTTAFGSRVKFVCSWKEPTQQQIGVHTGRSEKFSAAYYTNELVRDGMVVYWNGFFSRGFSEPGVTAKEFHIAQLKQLRFEPKGSDKFDDAELTVTGKSGSEQDDAAIATILGAMWAALFKFNPYTMRQFGIPVTDIRMRPPSQFLADKIVTEWKKMTVGRVPLESDPNRKRKTPG